LAKRPWRGAWFGAGIVPVAILLLGWIRVVSAQSNSQAPLTSTAALQTALDRNLFGVGLIDGRPGARTRTALADFSMASGMTNTEEAVSLLTGADAGPPFSSYVITTQDVLKVGSAPPDWVEASRVPRMAAESLIELLSEKFHASENLLVLLNPGIAAWDTNAIGRAIRVPNVNPTRNLPCAARIAIDCREFRLRAYDTNGQLVASFPCSIARDRSKAPTGALRITTFAANPTYLFDPKNYPDSPVAQKVARRLVIPAGPNNPVGDCWLGLNLAGFGIHGTPHPETIGRQESHGCFRLTNWDILRLSKIVCTGAPVEVTGL